MRGTDSRVEVWAKPERQLFLLGEAFLLSPLCKDPQLAGITALYSQVPSL